MSNSRIQVVFELPWLLSLGAFFAFGPVFSLMAPNAGAYLVGAGMVHRFEFCKAPAAASKISQETASQDQKHAVSKLIFGNRNPSGRSGVAQQWSRSTSLCFLVELQVPLSGGGIVLLPLPCMPLSGEGTHLPARRAPR